ncbi:MAG: OmpA family protein [Minicystis sp.]
MRKFVAPILCAFMMVGFGAAEMGCSSAPPPKAKAPRVRKKPPVTNFEMVDNRIKLPGPVVFRTGSDQLDPVSDVVLEVVLDYMQAKHNVTLLRIEGHTDSDGSAPANQALSEKRAMAVARWLADAGIDCRRLLPVGFGQTKPVAPNDTSDNKAQNRRVAFVNAAIDGRTIGNAGADGGGRVAGDPCR